MREDRCGGEVSFDAQPIEIDAFRETLFVVGDGRNFLLHRNDEGALVGEKTFTHEGICPGQTDREAYVIRRRSPNVLHGVARYAWGIPPCNGQCSATFDFVAKRTGDHVGLDDIGVPAAPDADSGG